MWHGQRSSPFHTSFQAIKDADALGGHTILQATQPNDQGFNQGFHIQAPGTFDSALGQFNPDSSLIDALNEYINSITPLLTPFSNGSIVNQSLQVAMTFRFGMEMGDAAGLVDC